MNFLYIKAFEFHLTYIHTDEERNRQTRPKSHTAGGQKLNLCDMPLLFSTLCSLKIHRYFSLVTVNNHMRLGVNRAGFNWWEAWGPVYLGGTERLQQLYD